MRINRTATGIKTVIPSRQHKPIKPAENRNIGRQYVRQSVGSGAGNIIETFTETLTSDPVTMANGDVATHEVLTESVSGDTLIQEVEWAVFISTDASFTLGELLLPYLVGISGTDPTEWDITGPYKSLIETLNDPTNGNTMPKGMSSERLTLRNISAGAVTVYFVNQVKYIVNGGGGES